MHDVIILRANGPASEQKAKAVSNVAGVLADDERSGDEMVNPSRR